MKIRPYLRLRRTDLASVVLLTSGDDDGNVVVGRPVRAGWEKSPWI